jgi:predicted Rossmann-fold nucleotide-binding protein
VPTPLPEVITPIDHSPAEVESLEELAAHLRRDSLVGLSVQGLDLERVDLSTVDVHQALFVGCRLSAGQIGDLVRRGAHVVPVFVDTPYPTQPPRLYTPDDLAYGFAAGGFEAMYDTDVYRHYVAHGGATPDLREALAQRVHDHGIDNALAHISGAWIQEHGAGSIVGVMGGHAEHRGSPAYRAAATLAWQLSREGKLILTGGGPGVMEAANLGSYLSTFAESELAAAIDQLAKATDFRAGDAYTAAALAVRDRYRPDAPWEKAGGLAVPTWFFGHEPANLFAAKTAKMFSNASREEIILKLARGGIVFAPGRAGTVQEVFQAATLTFYGTVGDSGPFVFLGRRFWTDELPIQQVLDPLLATSPLGDQRPLVHLTDDVSDAARVILRAEPGARTPQAG